MPAISIVHCRGDLFFGAAELFRQLRSRKPSLRSRSTRHQFFGAQKRPSPHGDERWSPSRRMVSSLTHTPPLIIMARRGGLSRPQKQSRCTVEVLGRIISLRNNPQRTRISRRRNALKRPELLGRPSGYPNIHDPNKDKSSHDER